MRTKQVQTLTTAVSVCTKPRVGLSRIGSAEIGLAILMVLMTHLVFGQDSSTEIEGGVYGHTYDIHIVNSDESYHDAGIRLQTRYGNPGPHSAWNIWHDRQNGKLRFSFWENNTYNSNAIGNTRMTLNSNGYLGLGVDNPSERLDVNGSALIRGNLRMDDGAILDVRNFQLKDWDDNSGGSNDKYRLLARDGAWMFYDGGVIVGRYANGTIDDLPNGRLIVQNRIGIGTTAPEHAIHIEEEGNVSIKIGNVADGSIAEGKFRGFHTRWGADLAMFGLRDYGTGKKDIVINHAPAIDNNIRFQIGGEDKLLVKQNGYVGIGTTSPTEMLEVNGNIRANQVIVSVGTFPDYVFADGYQLMPLSEVEKYIIENKHLPNVPAANEVEKSGVDVGQLNVLMMEKIEELTLHTIRQQKVIEQQAKALEELTKQLQNK